MERPKYQFWTLPSTLNVIRTLDLVYTATNDFGHRLRTTHLRPHHVRPSRNIRRTSLAWRPTVRFDVSPCRFRRNDLLREPAGARKGLREESLRPFPATYEPARLMSRLPGRDWRFSTAATPPSLAWPMSTSPLWMMRRAPYLLPPLWHRLPSPRAIRFDPSPHLRRVVLMNEATELSMPSLSS
jgi:hypothetical protein